MQHGRSEVVMSSGRQVDRTSTPVDVQREANEAQEEANVAEEETVQCVHTAPHGAHTWVLRMTLCDNK